MFTTPQDGAAPKALPNLWRFAVLAGILEELLFRGYLFRLSSRIVGTWGALIFTSALFGLAHLGNKGATLSSGIAIMLEAGVLLGSAYVVTQRLWFPIGLHIAWNFTEGSVFGMQVSGNSTASGLMRGSLTGSNLLTGGAFGPEASIVAVLVCLAVAMSSAVSRRPTRPHRTARLEAIDDWYVAPRARGIVDFRLTAPLALLSRPQWRDLHSRSDQSLSCTRSFFLPLSSQFPLW